MKYRSRWVCFNCHKSFSRTRNLSGHRNPNLELKCSECGRAMLDMGYLFPAPRKRDRKKWTIMALLADHKYGFHDIEQKDYIDTVITGHYRLTLRQIEENIKGASYRIN